ncbi:zinc finger protein OZF-like [Contarinia nasturtii]|uniref:zinc finger protein OZF-like n=1 Tax=Contarinia nasturtii TaxID=265458 RepID=UPI0012D3F2C1|nr:zinc finger protein OZF-like [Contarinia nasturtii]
MNPYSVNGALNREKKQKCKDCKHKQTVVVVKREVKEEPKDGVEMIQYSSPPSPVAPSIVNIKSESESDDELVDVKKEIKCEGECWKKDYDIAKKGGEEDENESGGQIGENQNALRKNSNINRKRCMREKKKARKGRSSKQSAAKGPKKHKCHLCNYASSNKPNVTRHIRTHTGKTPFECEICAKTFSDKSNLNRHQKIHGGIKPFACHVCSSAFVTKQNLNKHFRTHVKQLSFACLKCGHRFAQENEKQLHEDRCKCRRFQCYLCPHQCFCKTNLKHHMQAKHLGEKPFQCGVCEKEFSQKSNLKKHLATHAKQLSFRCAKCYRPFAQEDDKKAHEKRCNRRLHQCYLCKVSMVQSHQLKLHMRNHHTGDKPFPCKLCDTRFAMQGGAKHHMKTVHRQMEYSN